MKKITLVAITFFYLLTSIGIAINVHYCGGKVSSITFGAEKGSCACGKKMKRKSCCSDKHGFIKIQDTQKNTSSLNTKKSGSIKLFFIPRTFEIAKNEQLFSLRFINSKAPSTPSQIPLYLQNSVFII